jgi:hypothetical protein
LTASFTRAYFYLSLGVLLSNWCAHVLRLWHGHLLRGLGVELHQLQRRAIQSVHDPKRMLFVPRRSIPRLHGSNTLFDLPRWLLLPCRIHVHQYLPCWVLLRQWQFHVHGMPWRHVLSIGIKFDQGVPRRLFLSVAQLNVLLVRHGHLCTCLGLELHKLPNRPI